MTTMCLNWPRGPSFAAAAGPAAVRVRDRRARDAPNARKRPIRWCTELLLRGTSGRKGRIRQGVWTRGIRAINVDQRAPEGPPDARSRGTSARLGCGGGRLANDERRRDDDVLDPVARIAPFDHVQQHVGGNPAHLDTGLADRRQRWDRERGDVDIVEADDRELVRDDDPGLERGLEHPDRDRVRCCEYRRRAIRSIEVAEELASEAIARLRIRL